MTASLAAASSDDEAGARYDAFVSYARVSESHLVSALHTHVERFATPWYRRRRVRIYRDVTSIGLNANLWLEIETALSDSRHFILMASPAATKSPWVAREVSWWREHHPDPATMSLVRTSGTLTWDDEAGDFNRSVEENASPEALAGYFNAQPTWLDAQKLEPDRRSTDWRDAVGTIAARLLGLSKEALIDEDLRLRARALRLARSGVAALVVLLIAVTVLAVISFHQTGIARQESQTAAARQLASTAESSAANGLQRALLMSVAAYSLHPDGQTREALLRLATASPHLVRFLTADNDVVATIGSADGHVVIAGTADGSVLRWAVADGARSTLLHMAAPIRQVTCDRACDVVAATDGRTATVWRRGQSSPVPVPGDTVSGVGVSPSGTRVLIGSSRGDSAFLTLDDVDTARRDSSVGEAGSLLSFPSDNQVVVMRPDGNWGRYQLPSLSLINSGVGQLGAHEGHLAISQDGSRWHCPKDVVD
jgi:hypothetical protein